jgi:hypothetical protein
MNMELQTGMRMLAPEVDFAGGNFEVTMDEMN